MLNDFFLNLYGQLNTVIPGFVLDFIINHMTMRLVLANLVCFVLTLGGWILVDQLGCSFDKAIRHFQIYRFVTCMFVHDGPGHLMANMSSLIINGLIVESTFGPQAMLIFYFGSGIIGGIAACIIHKVLGDECISVGASGAICGLMGVTIMNTVTGLGITGNLLYVVIAVIPILIIGFSRGADNVCHFTSFFAGAALFFFLRM